MTQITLRNLDSEVEKEIRRRANASGKSLSKVIREMLTNSQWCPAAQRRNRLGLVLAGLVFDRDGFRRVLQKVADIVESVTAQDVRFRDLLLSAAEISRGPEQLNDADLDRLTQACRTPTSGAAHESHPRL